MPKRPFYRPEIKRAPSAEEPVAVHLRRPPPDAIIHWHRHEWGQLACPRCGGLRVSAAGMTWVVPVFRAVWIPPRIDHEVAMFGAVEFHAVYIDPSASPLSLAACAVVEVSPLMRDLIEVLAELDDPRSRRGCLMMALLIEELREAPPLPLGLPLPSDRRLKALCDAMMDDPSAVRTLSQWAPVVGASERTLARLFQTELHTSFGAWRRQLRLARAIDLIGRGVPLSEVAFELGYANAAAFSAMFKSALGTAPSRFARSAEAYRHRSGRAIF